MANTDNGSENENGAEDVPRRRLFGRTKSHPLSAHQQSLMDTVFPELELHPSKITGSDPASLFAPVDVSQVWLEIGFGGGEHLNWQIENNPDVGLIGCEPFLNGVAKFLTHLGEELRPRVRLYKDDAHHIISALPDASIARAFILFPDPWPKKRHIKRRLVSLEFLTALARTIRPGGELRFATDIDDYMRTAMMAFHRSPYFTWNARSAADWRHRPQDWPATRYEGKAVAAGRKRIYISLTRTSVAAPTQG